jgi:hypothetical protein
MANYSYNRIEVRGPLDQLAILQAENFKPPMGDYGDEHCSSWTQSDGENVLRYSGRSRRNPPLQDARSISSRHPDCLVELSYIDEGFCYDGCMAFLAGRPLFEDQCSEEAKEAIFDEKNAEGADHYAKVSQEHDKFFKSQRSELGWRPGREATPAFKAFVQGLLEDAPTARARELGTSAKLPPETQTRLALVYDAPALLREHALALDFAASLREKNTPFGRVPGFRAFLSLFSDGTIAPESPSCKKTSNQLYDALKNHMGRGADGDGDKSLDEALNRLLLSPRAATLLFGELPRRGDFASGNVPLGALLAFGDGEWHYGQEYGQESWAARAAKRFSEIGASLGAPQWIDAAVLSLARERPMTQEELAALPAEPPLFFDTHSGFGLLNDTAAALAPILSSDTLDALLLTDLTIGKSRAAIERESIERMATLARSPRSTRRV